MRSTLAAFSLALPLVAACGDTPPTPGGAASGAAKTAPAGPLAVGAPAPDLTLALHDGTKVSLASLQGKQVLVYFYPKDDTPGCTVEAQGIRDAWKRFEEAGVVVYGVSTQDAKSHAEFIDKHDLPFPLVVDDGGAVAAAFGVPTSMGYAARQSFLVGKDGKIKAAWPAVVPAEHADAVLQAAAKG